MVLAKADARIAAEYDRRLVPDDLRPLGAELRDRLRARHRARARGHRRTASCSSRNPVLRRSIDVRNPYVDPMNLRAGRAAAPRARTAGRRARQRGAAGHGQRHRRGHAQHRLKVRPDPAPAGRPVPVNPDSGAASSLRAFGAPVARNRATLSVHRVGGRHGRSVAPAGARAGRRHARGNRAAAGSVVRRVLPRAPQLVRARRRLRGHLPDPARRGRHPPKRLDLLFDCLDNEVRRCPACARSACRSAPSSFT